MSRDVRLRPVRREPVDLKRLAAAIAALAAYVERDQQQSKETLAGARERS